MRHEPAARRVLKVNMIKSVAWKFAKFGKCSDQGVKLLDVFEANVDAEKWLPGGAKEF